MLLSNYLGGRTATHTTRKDHAMNPDLRRRMGTAGRALVRERFTFAAQARRYVEVLGELAASRTPEAVAC